MQNQDYYENEYSQGLTTDMPAVADLSKLVANSFADSGKDWSYYNQILAGLGLGQGAQIFDFGCSWGYGSYQMAQAGYSIVAFDVAQTRRRYAEQNLQILTVSDMENAARNPKLAGKFDCFFSSHVLEHVPAPSRVFDYARALLKDGGLFVSFTPNGSVNARMGNRCWDSMWGEAHCNFIDDRFLNRAFAGSPRVIGSSVSMPIRFPSDARAENLDSLSGYELFFAARCSG